MKVRARPALPAALAVGGGLGGVSAGAMGCPGFQGMVTHPRMPWQCSTGALEPLRHRGAVSAADLLLLGSVAGAGAGAAAGTGTRGGITARLRPWPLGNQVSIWPRSGPSFPIPALIRGIARYYSFHNNIPVQGLCCDPAMGRVVGMIWGPWLCSVPLL